MKLLFVGGSVIALGKLIDYYDMEEEAYSPKGKKKKYPKTKKMKQHDIDYSKAKILQDKWKDDVTEVLKHAFHVPQLFDHHPQISNHILD